MSYELEAFLAMKRGVQNPRGMEPPSLAYPLTETLALIPLTWGGGNTLSEDWPEAASRGTTVARVSAAYFGGAGSQSATVWTDGEIVAKDIEINWALRRLGIVAEPGRDEWDTVGLGRFRKTSTWAAQAIREQRKRLSDPLPELMAALRYRCENPDQQQKVRSGAAQDLGELRLHEAIPDLVAAVEARGEYRLRIAAASALARIGGDGIAELARLLESRESEPLRKRQPHRVFQFVHRLMQLGRAGITAMAKLPGVPGKTLTPGDDERHLWPIVYALGEAGEAAAPAAEDLARMLHHGSWQVRIAAADSLGKIGPGAARVAPALLLALHDQDKLVRSSAAQALGQIRAAAMDAVPQLLCAITDDYEFVRQRAAKSLVEIGEPVPDEVVRALIGLLQDPFPDVVRQAVDSLGEVGSPAQSAVPVLIQILQDQNRSEDVRQQVCTAVVRINPDSEAVLQALIDATRDQGGAVPCAAAHALGALGPAVPKVVPTLIDLLRRPVPIMVLKCAANALGRIGQGAGDALPALRSLAQHECSEVRESVAAALARIGD